MRHYLTLAVRELKAQRLMAALLLIAVILSSLMTTAAAQSVGMLRVMQRNQASLLNGDRHATFHNAAPEQKEIIMGEEGLEFAGSCISLGSADLGESGMRVLVREYFEDGLSAYPNDGRLLEGRLPGNADEIALPQEALAWMGFSGGVGDRLSLTFSVSRVNDTEPGIEYTAEFTLSGILENNYLGYGVGSVLGIAGRGAAEKWLPEKYRLYSVDIRVADIGSFQRKIDEIAEDAEISQDDIQYNDTYLRILGADYREAAEGESAAGFSWVAAVSIFTGLLVLLAAGLVVYNILKISVSRRVRQYGTLRALGAERGQLYRLVTLQILLLCAAGIPAGALLGSAASGGILSAVLSFLNPKSFLAGSKEELTAQIRSDGVQAVWAAAFAGAVTLAFSFLAALPAARKAARVSPAVSMSTGAVTVKRKSRRKRRTRNFEAYYARLNMRRNPGRTAITVLSLVMSITVFITLQGFTALLDTSASVKDTHTGDYSVYCEAGYSREARKALAGEAEVEKLLYSALKVYVPDENGQTELLTDIALKPGETLQIACMDEERLLAYAGTLDKEMRDKLLRGEACLVKNPLTNHAALADREYTELAAGERLKVNGKETVAAAVTDAVVSVNNGGFIQGVQLIGTWDFYREITGEEKVQELYPVLKENADRGRFEEKLESFRETNGGTWLSYQKMDEQLAESFEQIQLLCWGLILFISLIGILNIVNTVYTNIHTRAAEIGVCRALGMSRTGLYQTFLWEGAYYGLLAAALGGAAGCISYTLVQSAAAEQVSVSLSWGLALSVAEAAAAAVAVCLGATALPLRRIAGMDAVEAIENVE